MQQGSASPAGPPALFREVHKHSWLHHVPEPGPGGKKAVLWWVVFCVHCDRAPYLEFYPQPALAATHQPAWRRPLAEALSVTAGLRPRAPGHRLVVLTAAGSTTLAAPTWEEMKDWVDTLRNKLREMKILQPKENVYSKPPEQLARPRASTRDPTSPLPPPPPGPAARVPGTDTPAVRIDSPENDSSDNTPSTSATSPERDKSTVEDVSDSQPETIAVVLQNSELQRLEDVSRIRVEASQRAYEILCVRDNVTNVQSVPDESNLSERQFNIERIPEMDFVNVTQENVVTVGSNSMVFVESSRGLAGNSANGRLVMERALRNRYDGGNNAEESYSSNVLEPNLQDATSDEDLKTLEVYNKSRRKTSENYEDSQGKETGDDSGRKTSDGYDIDETLGDPLLRRHGKMEDAWNCVDDLDRLTVNAADPEFTSSKTTAKISGMSVCLVDSLLSRDAATGADDDCFADFDEQAKMDDGPEEGSSQGATGNQVKRDSKGYTQVDLNAKKFEHFKKRLLNHVDVDMKANIKQVNVAGDVKEKPAKPTPAPRHKDIKLTSDTAVETKIGSTGESEAIEPAFGVYVSLTQASETGVRDGRTDDVKNTVKPAVAARRRYLLNRTSSVPDSVGTEQILDNYRGEMVRDVPECSNVTIITLSDRAGAEDQPPMAALEFDRKITNVSDNSNLERCDADSDMNTSGSSDAVKLKNNATDDAKCFQEVIERIESNVRNCSGTSYVNVSQENTLFRVQDDDEEIVFRRKHAPEEQVTIGSGYGHIRHSTTTDQQNKMEQLQSCGNNMFKIQVPATLRRQSEGGAAKKMSEAHAEDGVYESVFTPFTVSKNKTPVDKGKRVAVPRLVVDVPGSPKKSDRVKAIADRLENSELFLNSRQIVNINIGEGGANVSEKKKINENSTGEINANGDYEFLSWIRNGGEPSSAEARNENASKTNESTSRRDESDVRNLRINLNEDAPRNPTAERTGSNLEHDGDGEDVNLNAAARVQKKPTESNDARLRLFTRGLTELSIMSKFRNFNQRDAAKPVKTSQFYASEAPADDAPQQSTSGVRKGGAFTSKLNNMFGKNKNLENVVRGESSLRRNWSEHNDRTQPTIIRAGDVKMARPRPPAPSGPAPRRPSANHADAKADRRRSNSLSSVTVGSDENSSSSNVSKPVKFQVVLSLREQQVLRLRGEMAHEGGVRLLLRVRDCPEQAVALVDIYGAVWVAGWRQRAHPLLYNALHIGDRLAAVGGAGVSSARAARRALAQGQGQVELIIKRLPHGRVFALKKDSDKQDLGLLLESATITGIVADSPAHRAGVPGSGTLTEVNGRPLNLLLKKGDSQVKDRLNAIGRDVSILVQPTEFVSLLRSALKAVRGHKEYIVQ